MLITPACYSHLLSSLLSLANGKIAVVLEVKKMFSNIYDYIFMYLIYVIIFKY